jgi:hypothetical protein
MKATGSELDFLAVTIMSRSMAEIYSLYKIVLKYKRFDLKSTI